MERAAGVAVFSGRIHVSVSARASREAWDANAGMKYALFTADWQFQSPIERGHVEKSLCHCAPRLPDEAATAVLATLNMQSAADNDPYM